MMLFFNSFFCFGTVFINSVVYCMMKVDRNKLKKCITDVVSKFLM